MFHINPNYPTSDRRSYKPFEQFVKCLIALSDDDDVCWPHDFKTNNHNLSSLKQETNIKNKLQLLKVQHILVDDNPVSTRRYLDVNLTSPERLGRQNSVVCLLEN